MTLPVYIDITREEYEQFIKDQLKLQALEACGVDKQFLLDLKHMLTSSKIWNGMDWHYNPLHPFKYTPFIKKVETYLENLSNS